MLMLGSSGVSSGCEMCESGEEQQGRKFRTRERGKSRDSLVT